MQRLVNSIYRSRSFKIVFDSITKRVSGEVFLILKYRYSRCLLYYTKVLNDCKFQHKCNADKVKEIELNKN